MEWRDEAIVISARPHGETSLYIELFTAGHGRHSGLVRGGRSKRLRPVCQIGNLVDALWRARLEDHLGAMTVELLDPLASRYFDEPLTLLALRTICGQLTLFPERDPHEGLYQGAKYLFSQFDVNDIWPGLFVRFELEILNELGVGLDLSECAGTGSTRDLVYVSPKSGRAVSRDAGAPYKNKLLPLPGFLVRDDYDVLPEDIEQGLDLTGYFFEKHFGASSLREEGLQRHAAGMLEVRGQFIRSFKAKFLKG